MIRDTSRPKQAFTILFALLLTAALCIPITGGVSASVASKSTGSSSPPTPQASTSATSSQAIHPPSDRTPPQSRATRSDGSGSAWGQPGYEQPAGDIVTLTLNLSRPANATDTSQGDAAHDDAYIQIGSVATGFLDVLYVVDSDDDGEVTIAVNTRTLGTSNSLSATDTDLVYHTGGDQVQSAVHGRLPDGENAPAFRGPDGTQLEGFNEYLEALTLINGNTEDRGIDQLQRPLQPGTYPVAASTAGTFRARKTDSAPNTSTPGSSLVSTLQSPVLGKTTITLTTPGIDEVSVQAAPAGAANTATNQTTLVESLTERTTVTTTDRLVITMEATGIYGHLVAVAGEFDALETGFSPATLSRLETRTGEGVQFAVEAREGGVIQGPGPSDGIESPLEVLDLSAVDPAAVSVYANQSAGNLYVVVDPRAVEGLSLKGATERGFAATLGYTTDPTQPFQFDREDQHIQTYYRGFLGGAGGDVNNPAFPYFAPGTRAFGTSSFTLTAPQARFGSRRSPVTATRLRLAQTPNARINGTTNIAPGTAATLQVTSTASNASPGYIKQSTVTITRDQTFTGTVDVSASDVGDTVSVSLLVDDQQIASTTARIVGAEERTSMNATAGTSTAAVTKTERTAESGGSVPGFTPLSSVLVILAVLLGVAMTQRLD